jgi:hypothetical protein
MTCCDYRDLFFESGLPPLGVLQEFRIHEDTCADCQRWAKQWAGPTAFVNSAIMFSGAAKEQSKKQWHRNKTYKLPPRLDINGNIIN